MLKLSKETTKTLGPNAIALRLVRWLLFCTLFEEEVAEVWVGEALIRQREANTITMMWLGTGFSFLLLVFQGSS